MLNTYQKVLKMNDFNKDVFMGLIFMTGVYSFISGEFILSNVLFASAAVYSSVTVTHRLK